MAFLYIISTPIGNLEDITLRALRVLKDVDLILCEDTRVTKKLLNSYDIHARTLSYHQHSKLSKVKHIEVLLKKNSNLALVSDAGTPAISDPGSKLIQYLVQNIEDLKIVPIPGPSAVSAALSVSGFIADKFIFYGFPPAKKKRKKYFREVALSKFTAVFYESCHRAVRTLKELTDIVKELKLKKRIVVCHELTKLHEDIIRGDMEEVLEEIKKKPQKGEYVIVVE